MSVTAPLRSLAAALLAVLSTQVAAQTYSVSTATTDLGNVAAAATGTTVFTVDPSTGVVTKAAGNGARLAGSTARALVTISCGNQNACNNDTPKIIISQTGTPSGRANALTSFTLSTTGATATMPTPPDAGNTITATLGPIGKNQSDTIYVGFDTTYSGDNSAAATGVANASFLVTVTTKKGGGAVSATGLVTADVFRTLTITSGTPLSFGRISRPRSGSGAVSLVAGSASVVATGIGVAATSSPVPTSATLTASGEGGQALTITVPSSFTMTNGANSLVVTTNATNVGAQTLSGSIGAAGTRLVTVGGAFPLTSTTALGGYTGQFTVTFQYN